ncbi:MAG: hypothetical protein ACTSYR_03305 [Candidatus Odinarchaeia archaeon]
MPKGIVVIRWDDKIGTVLEAKFPDDLNITDEHIMRIFTTHALGDANPGFLSMRIEDLNVASYYSGNLPNEKGQFCISIILEIDEDAEAFEEILAEKAVDIIEVVGSPDFNKILMKSFEEITKSMELEAEQRFAMIFSDPVRLSILEKLTEGSITKQELIDWIKENKGYEISDLNVVLAPFIKTNLIRTSFVEGIADECIFLVNDIYALRIPVEKLILKAKNGELQEELSDKYLNITTEFFKNYTPSPEDVTNLAKLFTDPDVYSTIKLLRSDTVLLEDFITESKLSDKEPDELIQKLEKNDLLKIIEDNYDKKWLFLISDLKFITFFPEYMIDVIREKWNEGLIDQNLAIRHLELLKESFS